MDVACPACRRSVPGDVPLCRICGARLRPPVLCKGCGHEISEHLTSCPYCSAATDKAPPPAAPPPPPPALPVRPPPPAKPERPADPAQLRIDARSRTLWGEDRTEIRADLLRKGHAARDIDRALDEAASERHAHFRQLGKRDLLIAAGCLAGALVAFGIYSFLQPHARIGLKSSRVIGMAWLAMVGLPSAAVYFLIRGCRRIFRGGSGEAEASDIEEED